MQTLRPFSLTCLLLAIMAIFPACWLVYKPVGATKIFHTANATVELLFFKSVSHDTTYFTAGLHIYDIQGVGPITLSGLRMRLTNFPERPGGNPNGYLLQKVMMRQGSSYQYELLSDSALAGPLSLDPGVNRQFALNCRFFIKGKHHSGHHLLLSFEGALSANGQTERIIRNIVYKQYLYIDIAGN